MAKDDTSQAAPATRRRPRVAAVAFAILAATITYALAV